MMRTSGRTLRVSVTLWILALAAMAGPVWAAPAEPAAPGDPFRNLAGAAFVLVLVLLLILAKGAVVAFTLCASAFRPRLFRTGRRLLVTLPRRCFFVGLGNVALGLIASGALLAREPTRVFGLLLFLVLLLAWIGSRALVYQLLGMRLVGEVSEPESVPSVRAHCWGGAVVEMGFLVPLLGQVTMLVVTLTTVGAFILAALSRERAAAPSE